MTSEFTKALLTKLNTIVKTYFEEAEKNAAFPYAVVQNIIPRSDGTSNSESISIDIAFYQKDSSTLDVETIIDNIKAGIDRTSLNIAGKFSSYLYFETSDNVRDPDSDLISRSATITAHVFYL